MRCDQLVRYVDEAIKLLEKAPQRDAVFEAAGHLVQSIPGTLFKLDKALQAVALAATRMDYEEIKQELKPEKVQQLEKVLQDVRIRHVQRRSQPWEPKQAASTEQNMPPSEQWEVTSYDWSSHFSQKVMQATSPEDVRKKFKAENADLSEKDLDEIVSQWFKHKDSLGKKAAKRPTFDEAKKALFEHLKSEGWKVAEGLKIPHATSRDGETRLWFKSQAVYMSRVIGRGGSHNMQGARSIHVDIRDLTPEQFMSKVKQWEKDASIKTASDEEKKSKFEEGKPADPTENMSPEDAKKWKIEHDKNENNFKSAAEITKEEWAKALKYDEWMLEKTLKDLKTLESGGKLEGSHLSIPSAKTAIEGLRQVIKNKKELLSKLARDKSAALPVTPDRLKSAVDSIEKGCKDIKHHLAKGEKAPMEDVLSLFNEIRSVSSGMVRRLDKTASDDEEKSSKFEEGKPADPTENMEADDAMKWKEEHDKNKDRFKSGSDPWKA